MAKQMDPGKQAEKDVEDWLKATSDSYLKFTYHRYPDGRAARGALAAQPADFEVGCAYLDGSRASWKLEVKETAQEKRLPRSKLSQYGKLGLWHLAGTGVAVVVYRSFHRDWVVFRGNDLFDFDESPTSFPFKGLTPYPTVAAALRSIFHVGAFQ